MKRCRLLAQADGTRVPAAFGTQEMGFGSKLTRRFCLLCGESRHDKGASSTWGDVSFVLGAVVGPILVLTATFDSKRPLACRHLQPNPTHLTRPLSRHKGVILAKQANTAFLASIWHL
jgi:hypothetical protein